MSTHTFTHGDLRVQTGWDRPLQYFYLVIERGPGQEDESGSDDHESRLVYCNLDDPQARMGGLSLEQIQTRLHGHGVPIPEGLIAALQEDRAVNRGNHNVAWTT